MNQNGFATYGQNFMQKLMQKSYKSRIYIKIHVILYVCMFVCTIFSPTSHGLILKLSTFLETLGHGGPNKIVCSQIDAEIKKF